MTVPSTLRRAGPFLGNGSSTVFSFAFKCFAAGDLRVVRTGATGLETTLVLNSDYSVVLNSDQDASPGGTVIYPISGPALPVGQKITIISALEVAQTTDLLGGGAFNARVIEDTFDRTVIQLQQLKEKTDRAFALPVSAATGVSVDLPQPESNKLLGWNPGATALANVDPGTVATVAAFSNWRTDTFVGTGAQTEFSLGADPANVSNVDVAIDGVTQTPVTDFLLQGLVLKFDEAPPLGSKVVARYGLAIAAQNGQVSGALSDMLATSAVPGQRFLRTDLNPNALYELVQTPASVEANWRVVNDLLSEEEWIASGTWSSRPTNPAQFPSGKFIHRRMTDIGVAGSGAEFTWNATAQRWRTATHCMARQQFNIAGAAGTTRQLLPSTPSASLMVPAGLMLSCSYFDVGVLFARPNTGDQIDNLGIGICTAAAYNEASIVTLVETGSASLSATQRQRAINVRLRVSPTDSTKLIRVGADAQTPYGAGAQSVAVADITLPADCATTDLYLFGYYTKAADAVPASVLDVASLVLTLTP